MTSISVGSNQIEPVLDVLTLLMLTSVFANTFSGKVDNINISKPMPMIIKAMNIIVNNLTVFMFCLSTRRTTLELICQSILLF